MAPQAAKAAPAAAQVPAKPVTVAPAKKEVPTWYNATSRKYETGKAPKGLKDIGVAKGGIPIYEPTAKTVSPSAPLNPALAARYEALKSGIAQQKADRSAYAARALETPGGADMLRQRDAESARVAAATKRLSRSPQQLAGEMESDRTLSGGATDAWNKLRLQNAMTPEDRTVEAAYKRRMMQEGQRRYSRNQETLKRLKTYGSGAL